MPKYCSLINTVEEKKLAEKPILLFRLLQLEKPTGKNLYLKLLMIKPLKKEKLKRVELLGDYTEILSGIEEGDKVIQKSYCKY